MQKIRDAERSNIYNEYKDRVGDIVSGSVKLVARKDVFIELGKTEAMMPAKERIPSEDYNVGDTVRAYVMRVQNETSGPAVTLSRACPDFVKALFRQEVSEVAEGVVEIKSVARDPGRRSKVAVRSFDPRVDPASACIGTRGSRVRAIVQELNNEKLDIVKYSEDPEIYVMEALKPAQLTTIYVDDETHTVHATVPADKLSLAIGRNGQNVRLATMLTGWKIQITADEEVVQEEPDAQTFEDKRAAIVHALAVDLNIPMGLAEQLFENGFYTPEGILYVEPAYLKSKIEMSDLLLQDIYERANAVVAAKGE
jgi:N utilization substance protein A